MKKKIILGLTALLLCIGIAGTIKQKTPKWKSVSNLYVGWQDSLKDGDLIFQVNIAGQGKAIQLATHSEYTHIGILFREGDQWMVYEAVEPVQKTALNAFVQHGDNGKVVIKRLSNADSLLTDSNILTMKNYVQLQLNKQYDIYFGWNDDVLYCSELVWKCYNKIGLNIGPLKQLKTFDLTSPIVKDIMAKRYGTKIPYEESVISPGDIFDKAELITVYRN